MWRPSAFVAGSVNASVNAGFAQVVPMVHIVPNFTYCTCSSIAAVPQTPSGGTCILCGLMGRARWSIGDEWRVMRVLALVSHDATGYPDCEKRTSDSDSNLVCLSPRAVSLRFFTPFVHSIRPVPARSLPYHSACACFDLGYVPFLGSLLYICTCRLSGGGWRCGGR